MQSLRDLPSVEQLLQTDSVALQIESFGRSLTVQAIREVLQEARAAFREAGILPGREEIVQQSCSKLKQWTTPSLTTVINATGVILHTNLGRAPLSAASMCAIQSTASGYSNLEYDLSKGQRGSRLVHAEELLKRLTGAEAALVVNNNAAAVLLALTALARRRAVVIARSQLVEIGGGFRIPDVMRQSGARLVEVGTTNRVHLSDYEQAIQEETPTLVMRAHRSNFRIVGFTTEPGLEEIVQVSHQADIPVLDDLGSGALLDTAIYGLGHEPTVGESLASGVDLVCFSGDKLLGGPQAGILLGKADLIAKLKKNPLARAIRADKLCLAALSATLNHYLKDEVEREIPIWKMIAAQPEALKGRVQSWLEVLKEGSIERNLSTVGGGSLPDETLPTYVLSLDVPDPNRFLSELRYSQPPVIGRLEEDRVILDPRTVLAEQENALLAAVRLTLATIRKNR